MEVLRRISELVRDMVEEQYRTLNETVLPLLETHGVRILRRNRWTKKERKWAQTYFEEQVAPVLTPVGLDPAHPFLEYSTRA